MDRQLLVDVDNSTQTHTHTVNEVKGRFLLCVYGCRFPTCGSGTLQRVTDDRRNVPATQNIYLYFLLVAAELQDDLEKLCVLNNPWNVS